MLTTLIIFLLTLSLLVLVHEFGHFIAAKIIGVGVESFAIGFPPKIWSKKICETEYKINALPVGGYVTLEGEFEDNNETVKDKKSLLSRTPLEHFFIFVSGVLLNLLLGIILLSTAFMVGTKPIIPDMPEYKGLTRTNIVTIEAVEANGPADKAGVKPSDQIIAVNNNIVNSDKEVIDLIRATNPNNGDKVTITIKRGNERIDKSVPVTTGKVTNPNGEVVEGTKIGITLSGEEIVKANPIIAVKVGFLESLRIIKLTFIGIIGLFSLLLTKFTLSDQVTGPVGIYVATGYFAKLGLTIFIQFIAVISLSVALFNLLPIPALDGGQILFTLIEVVTRKKFSFKVKNLIQIIGFSLLIALMLLVTMKDLVNFNIINSIIHIFKG
jgi:regulator of sigma E protease